MKNIRDSNIAIVSSQELFWMIVHDAPKSIEHWEQ